VTGEVIFAAIGDECIDARHVPAVAMLRQGDMLRAPGKAI
jgi:hypothetical protein